MDRHSLAWLDSQRPGGFDPRAFAVSGAAISDLCQSPFKKLGYPRP